MLTSITPGRIESIAAASTRWWVSGVSGQLSVTRSDSANSCVDGHVLDAEFEEVLVGERIDGEHPASQVPEQPGHDRTDPAGADDAGRLAGEVEADEAVEREVAVTDAVVGTVDAPVQREDERQGVLGDRVG